MIPSAPIDATLTWCVPPPRQFAPDLVLVSCGFDAASGDRMGGMAITPVGFAAMGARLQTLANGRRRGIFSHNPRSFAPPPRFYRILPPHPPPSPLHPPPHPCHHHLHLLVHHRVVYALEGGYRPSTAARCTLAVLRMLLDSPEMRAVCSPASLPLVLTLTLIPALSPQP